MIKKVDEQDIEDGMFECDECGAVMSIDLNVYEYNAKWVEENTIVLGTECGCYTKYCLDNVSQFVNNPELAIDRDALNSLDKEGKVLFIESYRHSNWYPNSTTPEKILKEYYSKELEMDVPKFGEANEGVLFKIDSITPFDLKYSMWWYKND